MNRPEVFRRAVPSRRPRLEVLEDRTLPGEGLLSALVAACAADALAAHGTEFAPPNLS